MPANERMFELWGTTEYEMMNRPVFQSLPGTKEEGFEEIVRSAFTTEKHIRLMNNRVPLQRNGKLMLRLK